MFQAAARWIKEVREDKKLNDQMCNLSIEWRFNSSHASWWGAQFERLIGVFKNVFRKAIGNGTLNWTELEEIVLDIEICIREYIRTLQDAQEILDSFTFKREHSTSSCSDSSEASSS